MNIVYGLSAGLPEFAHLAPAEIGRRLADMGCDGVFLKHLTPAWIDGLHEAGLRVYASHAIFIDNADLWQRFPTSRPLTAEGEPAPQQDWYRPVRPTHQAIRNLRLEQIEQLAAELPLDGIWLDFIRWPARWEEAMLHLYDSSFEEETLAQFQAENEVDLPAQEGGPAAEWIQRHAFDNWVAWRCQVIARFVEDAAGRVRRHRPKATVGIFTIPWTGDAQVDRTGIDNANLRIVGQDLRLLSSHVDVISPMLYHRLCAQPVDWPNTVLDWAATECRVPIWPVIEVIDPPAIYPADEFARVHRVARRGDSGNVILFKLEGLLADPQKQQLLAAEQERGNG